MIFFNHVETTNQLFFEVVEGVEQLNSFYWRTAIWFFTPVVALFNKHLVRLQILVYRGRFNYRVPRILLGDSFLTGHKKYPPQKLTYTSQNKHGTWKWPLGKGDSYWKPSFPGSMLNSGGVSPFSTFESMIFLYISVLVSWRVYKSHVNYPQRAKAGRYRWKWPSNWPKHWKLTSHGRTSLVLSFFGEILPWDSSPLSHTFGE